MIIGNSGYGKPILDRTVDYNSSLQFALKAGFISFDATRISANDVDFPIDVIFYKKDSFDIVERRFEKEELQKISNDWNNALSKAIKGLSDEWTYKVIE
jgi:putative proteasome-type protease